MTDEILASAKERMEKAIASLGDNFCTVRTGRANAMVLDRIKVDYYGVMTPINQMAAVKTPPRRAASGPAGRTWRAATPCPGPSRPTARCCWDKFPAGRGGALGNMEYFSEAGNGNFVDSGCNFVRQRV